MKETNMSDPRFLEEQADEQPDLKRDLTDSVGILMLFRPPDQKMTLRDLLPALWKVALRIRKYDGAKSDQWRTKSVDYHMDHALGHLSEAMAARTHVDLSKNLAAVALRSMMALTCLLRRRARTLVLLRASEDRVVG